jgi:hypothetical protein
MELDGSHGSPLPTTAKIAAPLTRVIDFCQLQHVHPFHGDLDLRNCRREREGLDVEGVWKYVGMVIRVRVFEI